MIGDNPSIVEIIDINNEIDSFTFENKSLKGCLISNMTVKELKHPLKYFSSLNQIDLNFHYEEPYQEQMVLIDKNSILNKNSWDFIFFGNMQQSYVQVGNAVPPLLAEQLASQILNSLNN